MKTPERILTEHAVGEIPFNLGIGGISYSVFTPAEFAALAHQIKLSAYDQTGQAAVTSIGVHLSAVNSAFRVLRVDFEMLAWTKQQENSWIDEFCKPDNMAYYESKDEVVSALRWAHVRCIDAALRKCQVPQPKDYLTQSKVAADREVAEFEERTK